MIDYKLLTTLINTNDKLILDDKIKKNKQELV